jgi:RND family efflux transporter MFP subunit
MNFQKGRWDKLARRHIGTSCLVGLALLAGSSGCGRHGKAAPTGGSDVPPSKVNLKRNVELGKAEQRALVYYVDTVGGLEAEAQTDIAAGVSGLVDEVLFREGEIVDAKKILVKIDQRRYQDAVKIAEAAVMRAEHNEKLANDLYNRAYGSGLGSSAAEKAKASLDKGMAQAELLSAKASLDLARHNLDRSQVRAPYPGQINQRKISPGSFLEDKTVIATIADLSRLRLCGWVPETAAPIVRALMLQQEQRAEIYRRTLPLSGWLGGSIPWGALAGLHLVQNDRVPGGYDPEFQLVAYPEHTFRGRIFYLSTVANADTHMFEFKAEVDTRGVKGQLRPGYTARIRIPLRSNPDAVVVPEEAVRASERGFIAFVPVQRQGPDGQAEWIAKQRMIEQGYRSPGWVEVRRGIAPGEIIVRRGAEALEDGTPIRFEQNSP